MPLFGELFISEILKKPVLDPKGGELGRVKDVCVVKGEPLPKVDAIIIKSKKSLYKIPWSDLNIFNKKIISTTLYANALAPYGLNEEDLLAVRDILDKQIVDANGAKVVRANDIRLEGFGPDAMLVAVDVGMRGIMRRLGMEQIGEDFLRLFKTDLPFNLISWTYIQPLSPKLSTIGLTVPRQMVSELHPADLAELISQVSPDEGATFVEGLDPETAAEAISELPDDEQTAMFEDMDSKRASDIIEEMTPDDAADVLIELPPEKAKAIIEELDQQSAKDVQELLGHEKDTAGGLMTNEFIAYGEAMTVSEVIERFRQDAPEIETLYYIYVTNAEDRLTGVVSLKELLLSAPTLTLGEIMEKKLKQVSPEEDEKEVARIISKYNLVALPVTDDDGSLLGVVTVDDIMERVMPFSGKKWRRGV